MSRRSTRRTAAQQRSHRSSRSRFSTGRQLHRQLRLEPLEDRRLLAITVTTLVDTVDFNDGLTSLREAIFAANTVPGADTIHFDPALTAPGPATILLTQGELKITDSLSINGPGADLLTIDASGNDPTPEVNNGDGSRTFRVDDAQLVDDRIIPGTDSLYRLLDVSISDMSITGGDIASSGGAIFSRENLKLHRVQIEQNAAAESGGGITASYGALSIRDSTITSNTGGDGGGIRMGRNSISGTDPTLQVIGSTISGNSASTYGGGVSLFLSSVFISNSTITANVAQQRPGLPNWGGGVWADVAGDMAIDHSIIAGNLDEAGNPSDLMYLTRPAFPVTLSVASSLIGFNDGFLSHEAPTGSPDSNGNLIGGPLQGVIDPKLEALANNGGPTKTHALLPGSPAINAGDLNAAAGQGGVPEFDQRGEPFVRIIGGRIDIGAFEYQTPTDLNLLVDTLTDESDGDYSRGDLSLREAIELANQNRFAGVTDTIHFDPALTAAGPATILLTNGELKITDSLTINGPGAEHLSISSGYRSRILNVDDDFDEDCEVRLTGLSFDGTDVGQLDGGVIFNREDLTLSECVVENGTTNSYGGGIYSASGDVSLLHTTIRNNLALDSGGGVFLMDGTLEIADSTISGNRAPNFRGGGLALYNSDTSIARTTFAENEAYAGGGLFHQDGRLQVVDSQISGNTAWGGGGMRIARSEVEVTDSTFVGNRAKYGEGGGIRAFQSTLTITESLFEGNSGRDGGGLWSYGSGTSIANSNFTQNSSSYRGGAVTAYRGTLTVQDTAIVDNSCDTYGGGVAAFSAISSFLRCTIVGNDAGAGGGIFGGGTLTIADTVVRNNSASLSQNAFGGGGGVWCLSGELLIDRSHISDNKTQSNGGGIYINDGSLVLKQSLVSGNESNNRGGGIYTRFAHFAAKNTTVSGNRADVLGGGIYAGVAGHEASLQFTTISSNAAGEGAGGIYLLDGYLTLSHSVVAMNAAPSGPDLERFFVAEFVPHHSIVGDAGLVPLGETPNRIPDANGNLIGGPQHGVIDPQLGPLADNGGFELPDGSRILTHALLPGSPAINAGDLNAAAGQGGVPDVDQRGEPYGRIVGGRIDIGAFEYQAPTDLKFLVDTLADESDGDYSRGALSLREAIELANQNRFAGVTDTIHFDPALTAPGPATILLTQGELKITDSLTINGPGADLLTIDAQQQSRLLNIDAITGDFAVAALSLTGGKTIGANHDAMDTTYHGGAIRSISTGTLTLDSVSIVSNRTEGTRASGGGVFAAGSVSIVGSLIQGNVSGQGRYAAGVVSLGNVLLVDSEVRDNRSDGMYFGFGGGVHAFGNVEIHSSVVEGNSNLNGSGGGIAAFGSVTLNDSSITNNMGLSAGVFFGRAVVLNQSHVDNNQGIGIYGDSGTVEVTDSSVNGNSRGGISVNRARVTLLRSQVDDNVATAGGAGIRSEAMVTVIESTVRGNRVTGDASAHGGGISSSALVTIDRSSVTDNSTSGNGGGIYAPYSLVVTNSTIDGNSALDGGGTWSISAKIEHSTVSGNTATGKGGGVYSVFGPAVIQATISGNSAGALGGGIYAAFGSAIRFSTIAENSAGLAGGGVFVNRGKFEIRQSIVAENLASSGRDFTGFADAEPAVSLSLIGSNQGTGLLPGAGGGPDQHGNLIGGLHLSTRLNPKLGGLANNGGPTKTHALLPGSPAINAGDLNAAAGQGGVPTHDQRGAPFTRVYGGRIDIGAVESIPYGFLPGDYVVDGIVDAADYNAWRDSLGRLVSPGTGADGNGDGVVDEQDYAVWKSNFGATVEQLGAGSVGQGVTANAIDADELALAKSEPLGHSHRLAPPLVHAPQRPALSGVLNGLDRNQSPTFSPRDRALAAWFASRRSTALTESRADVEKAAHDCRDDIANSIDAALETLDDDCGSARRRALHALH